MPTFTPGPSPDCKDCKVYESDPRLNSSENTKRKQYLLAHAQGEIFVIGRIPRIEGVLIRWSKSSSHYEKNFKNRV